jgi:hypothetical protein
VVCFWIYAHNGFCRHRWHRLGGDTQASLIEDEEGAVSDARHGDKPLQHNVLKFVHQNIHAGIVSKANDQYL